LLSEKRVGSEAKEGISAAGVNYHHMPNLKIRLTLEKEQELQNKFNYGKRPRKRNSTFNGK